MRTASQFRLPIHQTPKVCLLFTRAACGPDLTSLHSHSLPSSFTFIPLLPAQTSTKAPNTIFSPNSSLTQTGQHSNQTNQQHHPPPKMATSKPAAAFTARETELLTIAFQCLKSKPDVRSQKKKKTLPFTHVQHQQQHQHHHPDTTSPPSSPAN